MDTNVNWALMMNFCFWELFDYSNKMYGQTEWSFHFIIRNNRLHYIRLFEVEDFIDKRDVCNNLNLENSLDQDWLRTYWNLFSEALSKFGLSRCIEKAVNLSAFIFCVALDRR